MLLYTGVSGRLNLDLPLNQEAAKGQERPVTMLNHTLLKNYHFEICQNWQQPLFQINKQRETKLSCSTSEGAI